MRELGWASWTGYLVSVIDGAGLPKLRLDDRRAMVAQLTGTGMSNYAISKALDIGYTTVARDLTIVPAERDAIEGLDGKRYPIERRVAKKPPPDPVDVQIRKAEQIQERAHALGTSIRKFITAMDGASARSAKLVGLSMLPDIQQAQAALDELLDWMDNLPGPAPCRPSPVYDGTRV